VTWVEQTRTNSDIERGDSQQTDDTISRFVFVL